MWWVKLISIKKSGLKSPVAGYRLAQAAFNTSFPIFKSVAVAIVFGLAPSSCEDEKYGCHASKNCRISLMFPDENPRSPGSSSRKRKLISPIAPCSPCSFSRIAGYIAANRIVQGKHFRIGIFCRPILTFQNCFLDCSDGFQIQFVHTPTSISVIIFSTDSFIINEVFQKKA